MTDIYEKIKSAVDKVAFLAKQGKDINQSVIDSTDGFTKESVQRVIEEVNVKSFVELLKSGQDKGQHFPVASPDVIFAKESKVKTSIDDKDTPDMSFYDNEKSASIKDFELPIEDAPKYSFYGQHEAYEVQKANIMQKRAEMYRDAKSDCLEVMLGSLKKVAEDINMCQSRADKLFDMARLRYGDNANDYIEKICHLAKVEDNNINNHSLYDNEIDDVKSFEQLYKASNLYRDLSVMEKAGRSILTGGNSGNNSGGTYRGFFPKIMDGISESRARRSQDPDQKKKVGAIGMMSRVGAGTAKGVMEGLAPTGKAAKTIKGLTAGFLKAAPDKEELAAELQYETDLSNKFERRFKQKKVIESLLGDDEILKEQDPIMVANLYKTLSDIAPVVATKKEIVRSYLRQVAAQSEPTVDPFFATQLIKLDRVLSGDNVSVKLD